MILAETEKQDWVEQYAGKILEFWRAQKSPLGIDKKYTIQLKTQLDEYFDNPLKRSLIETSY